MTFDIYFDNYGAIVAGPTSSTIIALPQFVQGDSPTLNLWPLVRTATYPRGVPYSNLSIAGFTPEVSIGQKVGTGGTIYTQQLTWTASVDPLNPNYWTAIFPMNTAGINTLLGSAASASAYFEIKLLSGGVASTLVQQSVNVQASVFTPGALITPPGFNPASVEYVNATFLTRKIQGAVQLVSQDGTKKAWLYLDNDGTFHNDPST